MLTLSPAPLPPPPHPGERPEEPHDWDARLSIDMIRQHTKTDDVPGVTDDQLRLYRQFAIEAAEHYTGMLLSARRTVTEPLARPRPGRATRRHRLRHPLADTALYVYGTGSTMRITAAIGSRVVHVPDIPEIDLTNCCDPCATQVTSGSGLTLMYQAGFSCVAEVPAGIVVGMLQFIAWLIEHPGDELLTQRNRVDARGGPGVYGSNNVAMVSGAIETWRQYDPEAI